MGKFLDKKQAATMLGMSLRSVYRALNGGLLRPVHVGGHVGVDEDDVVQLQRVRLARAEPELAAPMNRTTFGLLLARVRSLEIRVETVSKILGLRYEPLKLTDPEIANVYRQAEVYGAQGWPPHVVEQWADTFMRVRYEDLLQISDVLQVTQPISPFYRLCATMRLVERDRELRDRLDAGRSNLYGLTIIWALLHGESVKAAELALKREARPLGRVVRQLGRGLAESHAAADEQALHVSG